MQLFFSKPSLNAASMAQYLQKDEGHLDKCWRMFKKLRRGQSWKMKVFLRKTQGKNTLSVGQGRQGRWWHGGRLGCLAGKIHGSVGERNAAVQQRPRHSLCRTRGTPGVTLHQISQLSSLFSPIAPSFSAVRETFSLLASAVSYPVNEMRPDQGLQCREVLAQ